MDINLTADVCYRQPRTTEERVAIANDFSRRFNYPLPLAVDDIRNTASDAFAAWPERLYVIGEDGRIAYKGGMGPFDYKPEEVRAWLEDRFPAAAAADESTSAPPATR